MKPKHKVFADEWLRNGNHIVNAFLYISPNVTYQTAATEGGKLLKKPEIQEYIEEQKAKASERAQIDHAWILKQQEFILNLALIREKTDESTGEVIANPDLTNANKAMDQLSKLVGAYAAEKKEIVTLTPQDLLDKLDEDSQ